MVEQGGLSCAKEAGKDGDRKLDHRGPPKSLINVIL
jgi:hypothetical protein